MNTTECKINKGTNIMEFLNSFLNKSDQFSFINPLAQASIPGVHQYSSESDGVVIQLQVHQILSSDSCSCQMHAKQVVMKIFIFTLSCFMQYRINRSTITKLTQILDFAKGLNQGLIWQQVTLRGCFLTKGRCLEALFQLYSKIWQDIHLYVIADVLLL